MFYLWFTVRGLWLLDYRVAPWGVRAATVAHLAGPRGVMGRGRVYNYVMM